MNETLQKKNSPSDLSLDKTAQCHSSRSIISDSTESTVICTGTTGLTQQVTILRRKTSSSGSVLFLRDAADRLFKIQELENSGDDTKIR